MLVVRLLLLLVAILAFPIPQDSITAPLLSDSQNPTDNNVIPAGDEVRNADDFEAPAERPGDVAPPDYYE